MNEETGSYRASNDHVDHIGTGSSRGDSDRPTSSRPSSGRTVSGDTEPARPDWEEEAIAECSDTLAILIRGEFDSSCDFLDRVESFICSFKEVHL